MKQMRADAIKIIQNTIANVLPQKAVERALEQKQFCGNVVVIAVGKASWTMAQSAQKILGEQIQKGVVITKYGHSQGEIPNFEILEASHPIVNESSIVATKTAISAVQSLTAQDTVLFLLSGGGSALFEQLAGAVTLQDLQSVNKQLLSCGADIVEINTIRKHISAVKGGRFAEICKPASVYTIALSDVLGDKVDTIASGPTVADTSTVAQAIDIVEKYHLQISATVRQQLQQETPKTVDNSEIVITGSVSELCQTAAEQARRLGYQPFIISTMLNCEAKEAGRFLGSMAQSIVKGDTSFHGKCAIICGGETVVHVTGTGKGGRNQELALSAAPYLSGLCHVVVAAVGSDGTDGPTDAAGGIVDEQTFEKLQKKQIDVSKVLSENDSYTALQEIDGLIVTGPTGTNINDLYFLLIEA